MTDLRVGCGIAWPLSFSEKINFLEVSSCCIIIDFRLVIIHHNGINEHDMLVCMKLWLGHFYFYLLIQLFYVPWFHWHYHDTMTHDYNTRGKKDAGTFEDALKSIENNLQKSISGLQDDWLKRLNQVNVVLVLFQGYFDISESSLL